MEADVQYKQETKQRAEEQLEYASKVAEQSASEANVAKARAAGEAKALAAALEREVTNPNPNPKSKPDPEPSPNPSPNPNLDPPLTLSRTATLDPKPNLTQATALASPLLLAPLPVDWEEINDDDAKEPPARQITSQINDVRFSTGTAMAGAVTLGLVHGERGTSAFVGSAIWFVMTWLNWGHRFAYSPAW